MACYAGAMNAQTNKTFHHPSGTMHDIDDY
jgi:hypothetical protein